MSRSGNIGILGCGWLGLPLGAQLVNKGYTVKGSTTSEVKSGVLKASGIDPRLLTLQEKEIVGDLDEFLNEIETLVIAIPPGLRSDPDKNFTTQIGQIIPYLNTHKVAPVLFISSTSVFANDHGTYDEHSTPNPETESGKQLATTERLLLEQLPVSTRILRLGGLIAADRHPVTRLSGRTEIPDGLAPVNLIHRQDAIRLICKLIHDPGKESIYHGVHPYHPSRMEYYRDVAKKMELPLPEFKSGADFKGKTIITTYTDKVTGFSYEVPLV
ncbi:hypothetical protein [Robertkochia solimangrovi]|uniref:hypothetical protein n=1 Tax=Robertkochia solimangrovi TaxID=2213046 RepID=UPI00117F9C49|nr:hypothetical protein [Robertkochia solimangrovi]TRZ46415.1 hypothetical protein DMZ48_03975 [Robertkochia solimangrovi]